MKPLRIGIACYPTYGGSGVMATELGLALADRGHDVHLFSYERPMRLPACRHGITFHPVTVSSYPLFRYPPYDLALSSTLREVMAESALDVVHVHYAIPHAISAHLAREMLPGCRTRIVTTLHGTDATIFGRDPSYRDVIRFGLQKSDAIICVSNWLAEQTREVFSFDGPLEIVPNFVDQSRFKPRANDLVRNELGGNGRALLLHTSNFRPLKRALDTLEILRRLPPQFTPLLLLLGDGPDLPLVREAAVRHRLLDRVRFLGEIPEAEPITSAADISLLPSESESFGLAALEAMACGLPVVATRAGGLPEVVEHGATGFLHGVGAVEAMAADVARLLREPELRARLGQAGLKRASERFSLERAVRRHEELYASLLESRH
jgi:N-acetyl-alpha-D-glucosaminyl L-malate synthase BshA